MRAMKDSGVAWLGMIPVSWDIKPIGSGFTEVKNKNINNFPLDPLQFRYGKIVKKEKVWSGEEAEDTYSAYNIVSPDMIMINGLNLEFDFITQRVALVTEEGIITSTYLALKTSSNVYPSYANYLLKAYDACKVFHSLGRGLRKTLTFSELKKQPMLFLDYEEQKRIVAFLDAKCAQIDAIIEKQQQVIEKLKAYKQSVITEAVTKGLDPTVPMKDSGVEWIGEIPAHWNVSRIKYELDCFDELREPVSAENRVCIEKLYDYYGASGIIDKIDSFNVEGDYLLIGEDGANLIMRNLPLVYPAHGRFWVNNHAHILKPKEGNHFNYFAYLLEAGDYSLYITGSTQPKLSQENLMRFPVLHVPYEEQEAISKYLDSRCAVIDSVLDQKHALIAKLTDYKKSLIYEAVTGKMEV